MPETPFTAETAAERVDAFLDERSTRAGRPYNQPLITSWHGLTLTEPDLRELLADVEHLRAARQLLAHFVDDEPCILDQHGYCQNHGLSEAPCRNAEARRLLGMEAI